MRILVVKPGKHPRIAEIDGSLEQMQHTVGGYIQAVYPWEDNVALVCDEDRPTRISSGTGISAKGSLLRGPSSSAASRERTLQISRWILRKSIRSCFTPRRFSSRPPAESLRLTSEETSWQRQTPDGISPISVLWPTAGVF